MWHNVKEPATRDEDVMVWQNALGADSLRACGDSTRMTMEARSCPKDCRLSKYLLARR